MLRRLMLAFFVLMAWAPLTQAGDKRVALVIGNSAYSSAPVLANPANDAADMARALTALGFKVVVGIDLDKAQFDKTLRTFATELEGADTGLLFYSGHGLQVAGQNYLVPIDAKVGRERDLDFETVRLDLVLKQMELERDGKTNIVILDACRDNPLAKNLARTMGTRSASIGTGLAEVQTGVGTFIAYSTQPGNVALDGAGRNSPFTQALARYVLEPGQTLTSVMINVRRDVLAATSGKQVPWDHSALTGEFYFKTAAVGKPGKPGIPNASGEAQALKERIGKLEEDLKRKSDTSNMAASATLVQLKQRHRQLEDDNRRELDRLFAIQRTQGTEPDPQKRIGMSQDIGRIQIEMSRRGQDMRDLAAEIAKVEKELPAEPAAAKK